MKRSKNIKDNKTSNEQAPQRPQISIKSFKRLMKIIFTTFRFRLLAVVVALIISSVVSVMGSIFLQQIIDWVIVPALANTNPDMAEITRQLLQIIYIMIAVYAVGMVSTYIYNRTMVTIAQGTLKHIRDTMFAKMQRLPVRYFDTNTHGDVMSHYTNDIDTLEQMISQSMPQMFSSLVTIVTVVITMFRFSWQLTLFDFLFIFIIMIVAKNITAKSGGYFVAQQKAVGKLNGYIEELINGQKVVKVFNYEERSKKSFDELNENYRVNSYSAHKFSNILMPLLGNMANLEYVLIAIIGGAFAISGKISGLSLGTIASFLALTKQLNMPINQLSMHINSIVMALAGAERIFELMDEEPEVDDGYVELVNVKVDKDGNFEETEERTGKWAWKNPHHEGQEQYTELKGHIELEDVSFGYTKEKEVLHDISLYAKPGQKIAFVGATGAGKTTITNLINRFYDIEKGKIRYDGINVKKIKKDDLRKSLGLVLQDVNLFTGTIKENIKYGNHDATDEDVINAAKIANAHDFISMLPDGYDTKLTENGSQLSQGQRQLLSIARCALNNPPVMILDEATSSIDTRTEKIVQEGMDKLMEGRTVFVIAHRLSTVRNSKAIMVLEHGNIIERGNHEDLLALKGEYYGLYTGATELE